MSLALLLAVVVALLPFWVVLALVLINRHTERSRDYGIDW